MEQMADGVEAPPPFILLQGLEHTAGLDADVIALEPKATHQTPSPLTLQPRVCLPCQDFIGFSPPHVMAIVWANNMTSPFTAATHQPAWASIIGGPGETPPEYATRSGAFVRRTEHVHRHVHRHIRCSRGHEMETSSIYTCSHDRESSTGNYQKLVLIPQPRGLDSDLTAT